MTPQEAETILSRSGPLAVVEVSRDEGDLTAAERRFADLVFEGNNATQAYLEAFETKNVNTASSNGSRLLRTAKVERYLQRIREAAIGARAEKLIPWVNLEPRAQQVIMAVVEGRLRSRLQFEAAVYVVNRVRGTPVATAELRVLDQGRITGAITNLSRKLAEKVA